MSELSRFWFTGTNGSLDLSFPANGKEQLLTGYAFFGDQPWLVERIEVYPAFSLPTTVEIRWASGPPQTPVARLATMGLPDRLVFTPSVVEWPAHVSAGLYAKADGGGQQSVRVVVYYAMEAYPTQ